MEGIIRTIIMKYKLFKNPRRIGEVFEFDEKLYLIIGIEHFTLFGDILKVWYTCQDIGRTDYVSKNEPLGEPAGYALAEVGFKFNDDRLRHRFLGSTHNVKGQRYKLMEYREIKVVSTNIHLTFSVKPIYPISRKEAKLRSMTERKKKLQLEIF